MRIKGAFPVRWAAQDGKNGTGVTVSSTAVKYAVSNSGTSYPASGWQDNVPPAAQGQWVWTWTRIIFSDSSFTDLYSVSYVGIDGRGIQSSEVEYSQQENPIDPTTITDWGGFPSSLNDGWWLYTRTHIVYSSGTPTDSYSVAQIGVGSYYAGCQEYYAVFDSPTYAPSGCPEANTYPSGVNPAIDTRIWKTNRGALNYDTGHNYIYLWNFEISRDSRGNQYVTDAICIGNFAKGIVSIIETYATSAKGVPESGRDYPSDITEQMWVDEHQDAAPTEERPYQWNKTVTNYNDNTQEVHYHVSAVKGADGKGATYIDLDNENDSILYDGNGTRVSSAVTSHANLYSNGKRVSVVLWQIDASQTYGVTVKNNGRPTLNTFAGEDDAWIDANGLLTVNGISTDEAVVTVTTRYNNEDYYAKLTIKKLVGVDKYEIVVSPNAVTYNKTTQSYSTNQIIIKVYRTAQNGKLTLVENLDTYKLKLRYFYNNNGPSTITNYVGGCTRTIYPASYDSYRYELLDENNNVLDYETVPICRFENGDSAFILDVDNEMIGVAVDKDGNPSYSQSWEISAKAFYGSGVATGVTYNVSASGNESLINHTPPLEIGTYNTSTNKITVKTAYGQWAKDKTIKLTITATHSTYGTRTAYVTLHPIFPGQNGEPAIVYELKPSVTAISFARTSSNTLSPSQVLINCGYTKNVGGTITDYDGRNRDNLWRSGGAPYNMMYRSINADGTFSPWLWMKDLPENDNYALAVPSSTSYIGYEFILTSSNGVNAVDETNIIDRETIPITKGGKDGSNGFSTKTIFKNDFDKPATPTGAYPAGWTANPTSQADVSVQQMGDWIKNVDGYMVAPSIGYNQSTVQVIQLITSEANQVFNIRIKSNTHASYGYVYVSNIDTGHSTSTYKQRVSGANKVTDVSFTIPSVGCHTIAIGYVKSNYSTATISNEYVKFKCGKMATWQSTSQSFNTNGTVSVWSDPMKVSPDEEEVSQVQTHANLLHHTAFISTQMDKWITQNGVTAVGIEGRNSFKGNNSGNTSTQDILKQVIYDPNGETQLEANKWYTLSFWAKAASSGNWLYSFIYPDLGTNETQAICTAIDVTAGYIVDGVRSSATPTDTNKLWNLTTQFVRHTVTFKTRASIPARKQYVLFRLTAGAGDVNICMPKLEEGTHATDYCINEDDFIDLAAEETGFPNDRGQWVQDYGNDPYMWSNIRRDYVASNVSGDWKRYFVRRKGMTVPNGTAPTAGGNQYWEEGHRISVLLVNTVVGANAELTFAKSNRILVTNANGVVAAGLGGAENGNNDFPLWIGSSYENRASASFRVSLLGKLFASGAEISGKIAATDGNFGNLVISGNNFDSQTGTLTFGTLGDSYTYISTSQQELRANANIYLMNNEGGWGLVTTSKNALWAIGRSVFDGLISANYGIRIPVETYSNGRTIDSSCVVAILNPSTDNSVIYLPSVATENGNRVLFLHNSQNRYVYVQRTGAASIIYKGTTYTKLGIYNRCSAVLFFNGTNWQVLILNDNLQGSN
ncbi:MAG: hypothetical protein IJ640_09345 [Prevotella sp.]|nr:hypothetical protein [Prevotella sp.]